MPGVFDIIRKRDFDGFCFRDGPGFPPAFPGGLNSGSEFILQFCGYVLVWPVEYRRQVGLRLGFDFVFDFCANWVNLAVGDLIAEHFDFLCVFVGFCFDENNHMLCQCQLSICNVVFDAVCEVIDVEAANAFSN